MILDKKQMTEEDIKLNFITPAIQSKGWSDKITMETQVKFTDGKINLKGNVVKREPAKKADYILYLNSNNPIAIVEAKDNNHTVSYGIQQAIEYAKMLDIPFAYSSNGDGFYEHDFLTGSERQIELDEWLLGGLFDSEEMCSSKGVMFPTAFRKLAYILSNS